MDLYEFHALPPESQWVYIWDNGEHLMLRMEPNQIVVNLYDCGEFFAEVFFDQEKNELVSQRAFRNVKLLEPYLGQIMLGDLD